MNHERVVTKLFNYFYNKIYKGANFKLDLSINNQGKQVSNFLKLLSRHYAGLDSVGINFMIDYFAFAFCSYSDKKLKRYISLNWIIGKKTFQKFAEQKSGQKYYTDKFLNEYDINLDDLRAQVREEMPDDTTLNRAEENEKLRFSGDARLYHCLNTTTLYNHRSVNCLACENKLTCKRLLSELNPKLYKKRGYEK